MATVETERGPWSDTWTHQHVSIFVGPILTFWEMGYIRRADLVRVRLKLVKEKEWLG